MGQLIKMQLKVLETLTVDIFQFLVHLSRFMKITLLMQIHQMQKNREGLVGIHRNGIQPLVQIIGTVLLSVK